MNNLNKTTIAIFFSFIIVALSSCSSSKESVKTNDEEKSEPLVFTEINSGTNSGYTEKTTQIISTQNDYDLAWKKAYSNYFKKPTPEPVDFETSQLILVSMGEQNSGGHNIKVKAVQENSANIVITVEESKPGETCASTSVMTYPYQFVSIKKTDKKIIFETVKKTIDCNN